MECEHEINITQENWVGDNEVEIIVKCSLCKKQFRGVLKDEMV
jgi:hypothetical protein